MMVILVFSFDSLCGVVSTLLILSKTHLLTYLMFYIIFLLWFYFLPASICMSNFFSCLNVAPIILPVVSYGRWLILNFIPLWVKIQSYKSPNSVFTAFSSNLTSLNHVSLTKTISTFFGECFLWSPWFL